MRDLMMEMCEKFFNDPVISKYIKQNDIKFYRYPNAKDIKKALIVIDEIISPTTNNFADNNPLTYEYVFQIDIFIKQNSNNVNGSLVSRELILRISKIMWQTFGFAEFNSMKPEFIEDFNLYRQSKQFKGRKYIEEMEQ